MPDHIIQKVNKLGENDNITTDSEFLGHDGWPIRILAVINKTNTRQYGKSI